MGLGVYVSGVDHRSQIHKMEVLSNHERGLVSGKNCGEDIEYEQSGFKDLNTKPSIGETIFISSRDIMCFPHFKFASS